MLSNKLRKRLEWIKHCTDKPSGMYPGDWWDLATKQHGELQAMGFIAEYRPHNTVHKIRAVITDNGRDALSV